MKKRAQIYGTVRGKRREEHLSNRERKIKQMKSERREDSLQIERIRTLAVKKQEILIRFMER